MRYTKPAYYLGPLRSQSSPGKEGFGSLFPAQLYTVLLLISDVCDILSKGGGDGINPAPYLPIQAEKFFLSDR